MRRVPKSPLRDELDQPGQLEIGPVGAARRREQARNRGDRLQAAAAAAVARDAVGLHLHVAELARDAGRAAMERAAEDEPARRCRSTIFT